MNTKELKQSVLTNNEVIIDRQPDGVIKFAVPRKITEEQAKVFQVISGYRITETGFYDFVSTETRTSWSAFDIMSIENEDF